MHTPGTTSETTVVAAIDGPLYNKAQETLLQLLPIPEVELTLDQKQVVQLYQQANIVLGSAAAAPMICAGSNCPDAFRNPCPLYAIKKHPLNQRCPFEQQYVAERFMAWLRELERDFVTLLESERAAISTLVTLDLQERRCNAILAEASNASMVSRSVRDVDVESGQAICWEDVIHANAARIDQILVQRRMILRDFELTPDQKTKRLKVLNSLKKDADGDDLCSSQSNRLDRIRGHLRHQVTVSC